MLQELYENNNLNHVSKAEYDALYKEYKKIFDAHVKLEKRLNTIIKMSDRTLFQKLGSIENYEKQERRHGYIIKQGDSQGKALLDNTYNLEKLLNVELENERLLMKEIEETQKEVVFTMGSIAESRSKETAKHVKRVAEYSKLFALYYGLSEEESEILRQASPMHDIGKIGIADAILNKPGPLTKDEFEIMKGHAKIGYEMLKHAKRALMKTAAIVAYEHHERFDGKGYPRRLKGYDIHIYGRITAIADVFDALGSKRVYKDVWKDEKIFDYIKERAETQFDPKLVEIFFEHLDEFLTIRNTFKDEID